MLRFGSAFVILRVMIPTCLYLDPDPYFSLFGSGSGVEETPKRHKSLIKTIFCNNSFFGDYLLSSLDLVLEMFKGIENILKTNLLLIYVFSFFLPVLAF